MLEPAVRDSVSAIESGPIKKLPRRSLGRRIFRVVGRLIGGVLVLVVLLIAFLHTSWGKSVVRGRIEAKLGAAVNGEVTLGKLDYTFLFGSIELGDLEIRDASGRPAIRIASIAVDLDRGSLIHGAPVLDDLAIEGLVVDVVQQADGKTNLTGLFKPSDRKPLDHITIAKLGVTGSATITKPDGTVITVGELGISGKIDAHPATQQVDAMIDRVAAKLAIAPPNAPVKRIDLALTSIDLKRRADSIDVDIASLGLGAVGIDKLGAHVALVDGKPRGMQKVSLGKVRVDSKQLASLLGRQLLLDDVTMDVSVTGPEDKLALHGAIRTRNTTLTLDGTADVSKARPAYELAVVGKGRSADVVVPKPNKPLIEIESDVRIDVKGAGATPLDLDAVIGLTVGPTKIGKLAIDGLTAKATANHGAYRLDQLTARGLDFEITASGDIAADKTLNGRLGVTGSPARAIKILAAAGIAIPRKVPLIDKLSLSVTASGKIDGELDVALAPTRIAIAGGAIGIAGSATLDNKVVRTATTKIDLDHLDLAGLSALAGKPPKAQGTLSGTLRLVKTGATQTADYQLAVALKDKPLVIHAKGTTDATSATAHAEVLRADRSVLATLDANLPLDPKGFQPTGPWKVSLDVAKRSLADIVELLPERLRDKVPAGDVAIHANLAGSPAAPTGTITLAASVSKLENAPGPQRVALTVTLAPKAGGLAVTTAGTISIDGLGTLATIGGGVTTPALFVNGKVDAAKLRAGLDLAVDIEIPERTLSSLSSLRAKLAEIDGTVGGTIHVRGPAAAPALDASLRWAGYRNAAGGTGETTIAAKGTTKVLTATIGHAGALAITADIDRSNPDRIAIKTQMRAGQTALRSLIPAFAAGKLGSHELGTLRWNMDGNFVLVRSDTGIALDTAAVTGGLDLAGAALAIPGSNRRYHDIGLAVVGDPNGIRITSLAAHETDIENKDRRIDISGLLTLDKLHPKKLELSLAARDWLLFGSDKLGMADAPRATATFDIGVAVDLTTPVLGVDATIHSLAFHSPDRMDRAHQFEHASVAGDIIYVDSTTRLGKLPVAPVVVAAEPKHRRPIDVRIHIPKAIRLEQVPFDVMAHGEFTVTVRDEGVTTRGGLTMERGKLNLFGRDHALVDGSLTFTDEHPHGWLALTFERTLPDIAMRQLSRSAGGARIAFSGEPTKPKPRLEGAANSALMDVMSMYNAGGPLTVTRPGLPASSTVNAPRGDQLFMLTFMQTNLPHLLFLDRMAAWADPYQGKYGEISNMEAEHYAADHKSRVRAVVRPNTPGRSTAELQWDRVLIDNDRAALGVGVRAGDRIGGGLGLFFEWSSRD